MTVRLTIIRYPAWAIPFAFLAMAWFRLPLWLHKPISFWCLMGSGRNGSFSMAPDLRQWAILTVHNGNCLLPSLITAWIGFCKAATITYYLQPIEGHGLWNGKEVFGTLPKHTDYDGEIAIITRATIRLIKLFQFWKHVPKASAALSQAEGLTASYGIGEIPFVKQATFSIWKSKQHMTAFAYQTQQHKAIVQKTHAQNWYSEQMFVRFKVLKMVQSM